MKKEENQTLTSFEFFTMVLSFAVILGISAPIIKKNMQSGNIEIAQRDIHNLAFSLLKSQDPAVLRLASAQNRDAGGRSVASVGNPFRKDIWEGKTGMDPWGKPYHFRFLRNSQGMPSQLVVWSSGSEFSEDTPEVKTSPADGAEHIFFKNETVAAFVPVR